MRVRAICLSMALLSCSACTIIEVVSEGEGSESEAETELTGDESSESGAQLSPCEGPVAPAGTFEIGQPVSRWAGQTSSGASWDYCELAGTPFLVLVNAGWCAPCMEYSRAIAGEVEDPSISVLLPRVADGSFALVELLLDGSADDIPSAAWLAEWEASFPNENVIRVGDPAAGTSFSTAFGGYTQVEIVPWAMLVNAEFELEAVGLETALELAASTYAN